MLINKPGWTTYLSTVVFNSKLIKKNYHQFCVFQAICIHKIFILLGVKLCIKFIFSKENYKIFATEMISISFDLAQNSNHYFEWKFFYEFLILKMPPS